jgi:hypothetical protein
MNEQNESDGKDLECGDFVTLSWLVKSKRK